MKYAVELYFDPETEEKMTSLARRVADEGLSTRFLEYGTRPHLTLACFNDVDESRCIRLLQQFAGTHGQLPAYIGSVGMFNDTRTIFAAPVMHSAMYRIQRELHECMAEFDTKGWEWYLPERWAPHCTLALAGDDGEEAFLKASELILRGFRKMAGRFVAVGLVKVTLPVEEVYTALLGQ
ncbi:MAG: 2'-5' RNA ligase family protein [Clostridia bacterium]|nr:2'-5' RNA ligase family protein [Clostridia bacterium]